jgi:uracil-DNA glycosylase family 4
MKARADAFKARAFYYTADMAATKTIKDTPAEAPKDCPLCPRLVGYREANARAEPTWFNGAAPSFGDPAARLLIVGLAPGRMGANRTGRPFTGDYAGELLYGTLKKLGLAEGEYRADPKDGFTLKGAMITNAVRCAPPENKPTPAEIATCRPFLGARMTTLPKLKAIFALGSIAHESVLRAHGLKPTAIKFAHGAGGELPEGRVLVSSYHCSRYNTQTRRLTAEMFEAAMRRAKDLAYGATP